MPRKTGTLRREQTPTVRPQVAGILRAEQRELRKTRREHATRDRRNIPQTSITTDGR